MAPPIRKASAALGGIVLAGGLAVAAPAPTATPAPGDTEAGAASRAAQEYGRDAFVATNSVRANRDRSRLAHHDCLHRYAKRQARKMAERQEIWHQDMQRILRDCHLDYVGENVAAGFRTGRSVVRDGWMRSEGHRENVLDGGFRRVEVVARKGGDGRWYAAQVFGRPR